VVIGVVVVDQASVGGVAGCGGSTSAVTSAIQCLRCQTYEYTYKHASVFTRMRGTSSTPGNQPTSTAGVLAVYLRDALVRDRRLENVGGGVAARITVVPNIKIGFYDTEDTRIRKAVGAYRLHLQHVRVGQLRVGGGGAGDLLAHVAV
jgi:hypothetical protein